MLHITVWQSFDFLPPVSLPLLQSIGHFLFSALDCARKLREFYPTFLNLNLRSEEPSADREQDHAYSSRGEGHNLPATVTFICMRLILIKHKECWLLESFSEKAVGIYSGGGRREKGKRRDMLGSRAMREGRQARSTVWVCVVFNSEVGGGEEEQEKEEEGVLPLQSGLSCWCIPAAPVHSNRKPWYKKLCSGGNPPKCLTAAAWPGRRAWECGLSKTMPSLIIQPINTQHFIMDRDDRKRNKNMWVKPALQKRTLLVKLAVSAFWEVPRQ